MGVLGDTTISPGVNGKSHSPGAIDMSWGRREGREEGSKDGRMVRRREKPSEKLGNVEEEERRG